MIDPLRKKHRNSNTPRGRMVRVAVCAAALIWGLAGGSTAVAQDDQVVADLNSRVLRFFDNVHAVDDPEKAFEDIIAEGPLADPRRSDDLAKLVSGYRTLQDRCGAFLSAEAISSQRVGQDLVNLKFLYKAQQFPIVWYFVFYHRPDDEATNWVLVSLRFDTQLEALSP